MLGKDEKSTNHWKEWLAWNSNPEPGVDDELVRLQKRNRQNSRQYAIQARVKSDAGEGRLIRFAMCNPVWNSIKEMTAAICGRSNLVVRSESLLIFGLCLLSFMYPGWPLSTRGRMMLVDKRNVPYAWEEASVVTPKHQNGFHESQVAVAKRQIERETEGS